MNYVNAAGLLVAVLAAMPATSDAQQLAATAKDVNLRAGPARDYPVVAILPRGLSISVAGCLSGYRWCDVLAGPNRGWVYAANIVYPYQGANVPLLSYGAVIGIGIIGFNLGNYWDQYYRGRPWYPQRQRWIDRPRPAFTPHVGQRPPQGHGPRGEVRPPHEQGRLEAQHPPSGRGPNRNQRPPEGHDRGGDSGR